jgi:hypothetical protein
MNTTTHTTDDIIITETRRARGSKIQKRKIVTKQTKRKITHTTVQYFIWFELQMNKFLRKCFLSFFCFFFFSNDDTTLDCFVVTCFRNAKIVFEVDLKKKTEKEGKVSKET